MLLLQADGLESHDGPYATRRLVLAGALVGAATGFKLTNAVFAVGLVAAGAVPWLRPKGTIRAVAFIAAGGVAGFLATGGAWAVYLWASLGNPVFPALNKVFRSPSAALSNYADLRFLPGGILDGLTYPVQIAFGLHPTAEVPFAEPRFLLALLAAAMLVVKALRAKAAAMPGGRRMGRAAVFLAASMASWIGIFAIQRYAVALELLCGVVLVMAVPRLVSKRLVVIAALAVAAMTVAGTRPPDLWRRPWANAFTAVPPSAALVPAAYVLVSHPIGYWASMLPAGSRFYTVFSSMGLATGGVLQRRMSDGLAHPPNGLIWTLGHDFPMDEAARDGLVAQGLVPSIPCYRARSLWWVDTIACQAKQVGMRPRAAADLTIDEAADFSWHGSGWIYLGDGWRNAGQAGTATQGHRSELVLRPDPARRLLALDFTLSAEADSTPDGSQVVVVLDGVDAAQWSLPHSGQPAVRSICVPPQIEEKTSNVLSVILRKSEPAAPNAATNIVLRSMLLRDAKFDDCGRDSRNSSRIGSDGKRLP